MGDPEERERESQESDRTKYEEAVERESEERSEDAERVGETPQPEEEVGTD